VRRGAILFALAWIAGCAERDNPFDPLNLSSRPDSGTKVDILVPKLRDHVKVLMEDSAKKYQGMPNPPYAGNLMSALSTMVPGDTLYIYGGGGEYTLSGQITIAKKGALGHPIVIRSFGGQVVLRSNPPPDKERYQKFCLEILESHVKIVGLTCIGGKEYGLKAGNEDLPTDGSLELDSVRLENPTNGIAVTNLRGPVVIRNLVIQGAAQNVIPVKLVENLSLDTSNIFW